MANDPLVESLQAVLSELSVHGGAMLISRARGGLLMGACSFRAMPLPEIARVIARVHDFERRAAQVASFDLEPKIWVTSILVEDGLLLSLARTTPPESTALF